jgi:hypothetical protein
LIAAPVIPSDFAYQSAVDRCSQQTQLAHPTGGDVTPASEAFVDRDRAMGRDTSGIVHLA